MAQIRKRICCMAIAMLIAFTTLIAPVDWAGKLIIVKAAETVTTEKYLDECTIIAFDQYDDNEGDSFIYPIGQHSYTRGNTDINGASYNHGIEAWIARWNYTPEQSWASATFDVGGFTGNLTGLCVLIDSYNTTNFDTTAYFYGDGDLLASYNMKPDNIPFSINIEMENVKELRIFVEDNDYFAGGTSFGFTDMRLVGSVDVVDEDYFKLKVDTNQFIHYGLPYSIDNREYKSKLYKSSILTWDGTIQLYKYLNGETSGVCHGIAATMCYGNQGYLDFNNISSNAQNYWQLGDPRNNTKFKDVIVYYHLLQLSTEGKATKTLDKGGWHTLSLKKRMSSFLGSLVDEAKKSQETKKPFIFSFRENGDGHSVVVCGYSWNSSSKSHQIKIYDENSYNGNIGNYTTMTIPEDCLSFDFADANASYSEYKIQDVWSSLSYYGIDKIYGSKYILKAKGALKMLNASTQTTIQITTGKKFRLENNEGKWLAYDGQDYTGNMTVYDCYTSGLEDVSVWNITIDSNSKFILKNADDGCELIASIDNKGFAVSSIGADSIQIQSDGVMAKGISYKLDVSVQSDKCDIVQIQTDVKGDATVSEQGDLLTISSTDSCENTKVYAHDNAETEILETEKTDDGNIIVDTTKTSTSYTICYNLNGGQVTRNPTTYTKDTETFTLNNPTKAGYTFTGWTGSNGNTPQKTVTISKGTTGDLFYVANWEQISSIATAKVTLKKSFYIYDGKKKQPVVTVKIGNTPLLNGTHYKVSYKNNMNIGTASVTIDGIGNYNGSITKTFTIVPKGTSLSKVSTKKKGFSVNWKKQAKSTNGYQVQYSTSKKFTGKATRIKTVTKNKITKLTVSKLKGNKKYYVRIRTYKTVKGKKYYSSWSKAKAVMTKK